MFNSSNSTLDNTAFANNPRYLNFLQNYFQSPGEDNQLGNISHQITQILAKRQAAELHTIVAVVL